MKLPYFTTDELIKAIKRNVTVPVSQKTFQDEDFIAFLNEEMSLGLVPQIMKMKEDYLLTIVNIPIEAGLREYQIPARAVGNKLKELAYVDGNGNICEMTKVDIGDLPFWNNEQRNNSVPYAYFIANNVINLISTFNVASGFLQFTYYMRPNQLVMLKDVGIVQSIDTITGQVFLDKVPTDFNVNKQYDVVQQISPHKCLTIDLTITGLNTVNKSVTFATVPTGLKVGDHLTLAQQSAIPQIPSDMHPILGHRAGRRCVSAQGDTEAVQVTTGMVNEFQENSMNIISDRVEDSPKKIVGNRNLIRTGISRKRYRFRG